MLDGVLQDLAAVVEVVVDNYLHRVLVEAVAIPETLVVLEGKDGEDQEPLGVPFQEQGHWEEVPVVLVVGHLDLET